METLKDIYVPSGIIGFNEFIWKDVDEIKNLKVFWIWVSLREMDNLMNFEWL